MLFVLFPYSEAVVNGNRLNTDGRNFNLVLVVPHHFFSHICNYC